jgi:hypothetical protein
LLEQIRAGQHADNIRNRLEAFAPPVAQAQAVLDSLPKILTESPPVTQEFRIAQVELCLDALNQFIQDVAWLTNFYDELYYSDDRVGAIAPSPGASGLVFSTRYILPDYLGALYVFVVVTKALFGSLLNYLVPLRRYRDRLQWVHDTATAGITELPFPSADEVWSYNLKPYLLDNNGFMRSPWSYGVTLRGWPLALPDENGGYQWYGAVDEYTGYNSLGSYPGILPPASYPPDNQFNQQFFAKLRLASLKRWKDVYIGLGLPVVWQTINTLDDLVGDPHLPEADRSGWSLRELDRTLGPVHLPANVNQGIPVSMIVGTLAMLRGQDPERRPLSLREQVNALPYQDAGVQPI